MKQEHQSDRRRQGAGVATRRLELESANCGKTGAGSPAHARRERGPKDSRSSPWRQCLGDLFPESLRARLPRSSRRHKPVRRPASPTENRSTPGVSVCPLHVEGRRLDAVRRVLQEMGLDRFDLIRLDAETYAVREPVIGAGRHANPRARRTVRSLVRVTAWDGHQPAGIEFEDSLETA